MEQEIIVFEAPPKEEEAKETSEEEKYTLFGKVFPKSIVDAVRILDDEELHTHFDSTIPALMVQEIMKYFYPIWDRLNEGQPATSPYAIKIPLKTDTYGYYISKAIYFAGKSGSSADVIGFRIPKILAPQHRYVYNPMWEELFRFPPLCNPKYLILNGRFSDTLISEPNYFVQQTKDFPHMIEYPGDLIRFTSAEQSVEVMKDILGYLSRMREYYSTSLSVYYAIRCGPFKKFLNTFYTIQPDDARTVQVYTDKVHPLTKQISIVLDLCSCSLPDLGSYSLVDLPLDKRDSWWLSLSVHHLTTLYILLTQGSKMYDVMLAKIQEAKHMRELGAAHAIRMTEYLEVEAIKLSIARAKFGNGEGDSAGAGAGEGEGEGDKHKSRPKHGPKRGPKLITKLSQLSKPQLGIVNKEYEAYLKMKQVPKEILRVVKAFQTSLFGPIEVLRDTFNALKETIKIDDPDTYIKYTLCRHRIDVAKHLLAGKSKKDTIDIIKQEYAVPDLLEYYGFFCSTCGEMVKRLDSDEMMEFIDFGDIYQGGPPTEDPLGILINKIVVSIVNHDLIFSGVTRLLRIVDYIANVIRPRIQDMEKQLLKSKTMLIEHITDLLSIYVHIYAMAIITRMVALNPASVQFVGMYDTDKGRPEMIPVAGGGSSGSHKQISMIVSHKQMEAADSDDKHYRIHNTCGVEDNGVFPDAPRHWSDIVVSIAGVGKPVTGSGVKPRIKKRVVATTTSMPIAQLLSVARRILMKNIVVHMRKISAIKPEALTGLLVKAYQWAATLKETRKESEVMKHKIGDLLATMPVYRYMRLAHLHAGEDVEMGDFTKVLGRTEEELNSGTIDMFANAPVVEKWVQRKDLGDDALDYQYRSYLSEMRYVRNSMYRLVAAPDSQKDPALTQFEESFADLVVYEKYRDWRKFLFNLFPLIKPVVHDPKPAFYYSPIHRKLNYAQYYDNAGKPRKWNSYIYETPAGGTVVIPTADIIDRTKQPDFAGLKFVDWGFDNLRYSTIADPTVEEVVKVQFSTQCLYEYYNNRCPEGDLHVVDNDAHCTKCGMGKLSRDAYYKKYRGAYRNLIKQHSSMENNMLSSMNSRTKLPVQPKLSEWKITQDIVLRWSKTANIEFNRLNSIGLYWRCMEDDIVSGKCDPLDGVTDDDLMSRLNILKSYYLYIVRFYNSIKYDPMVNLTDADLEDIFKKHKDKISGLHSVMPAIKTDLVFLQVERETSPGVACNFMLSTIANMLLQIESLAGYQAFGHDIFMYVTKKIIRMEYMSTKPPPYSRSSIRPANPVVSQYDQSDDEVEDDMAEAFSDVEPAQAPIIEEVAEGENPADIFSFDNSDIAVANEGDDDGNDTD